MKAETACAVVLNNPQPEMALCRGGLRPWRGWLRAACSLALLGLGSLLLAAVIGPSWIDGLEALSGRTLSYEEGMRLCLGIAIFSGLAVSLVCCWSRWTPMQRRIWWTLSGLSLLIWGIFLFDKGFLLQEEGSWIKLPTAGSLILAGTFGLGLALRSSRRRGSLAICVFWGSVGCGFLFAGLDEYLEIHERLGRLLRDTSHPALASDLITVGYFLVSLAMLGFFWRILAISDSRIARQSRIIVAEHRRTLQGYLAALLVFGVAQFFDTFDKVVYVVLQRMADWLLSLGHQFPDVWYLLYHPRQLMNSIEEILECAAAVLFLFHTWTALRPELPRNFPHAVHGRRWRIAQSFLFGFLLALLIAAWPPATRISPVKQGADAFPILGNAHQMARGADDLASFAPSAHLFDGRSLVADGVEGEILQLNSKGGVLDRVRMRRMFRDLLGLLVDDQGQLYFVTGNDGELSFLPEILWVSELTLADSAIDDSLEGE